VYIGLYDEKTIGTIGTCASIAKRKAPSLNGRNVSPVFRVPILKKKDLIG